MRKLLKHAAAVILVPLTRWYLRKKRTYKYGEAVVTVLPGVFHPGLFSSTRLILGYLENKIQAGDTVLEIGSGTGLISVIAAKAGARVTALDISIKAVENTKANARTNQVEIEAVHSDLFQHLKKDVFRWIIINPPYYTGDPKSESDFAWYCGENFEYFKNLFSGLPNVSDSKTFIIMALTKGCDLEQIFAIGKRMGFSFALLREKKVVFDGKDMLYKLNYTN